MFPMRPGNGECEPSSQHLCMDISNEQSTLVNDATVENQSRKVESHQDSKAISSSDVLRINERGILDSLDACLP